MASFEVSKNNVIGRLRTQWGSPLYRNGLMLVLSSGSTSVIGVVYWILAARLYSPHIVGINSAAIASILFLASLSQLNLVSALTRFIPIAGHSTRKLVLMAYFASFAVAMVSSLIFLVGVKHWSPVLAFFSENWMLSLWFGLSVAGWCVFSLQDGVLTGLRFTSWVPTENIVFALAKIALLVVFLSSLPFLGIFASWTLGLIITVIPTNIYIFFKLIKRHEASGLPHRSGFSAKQVIHYVSADYLASIFGLFSTTFLPVIVASALGAVANATFYLAWTIANSLFLIPPNVGTSMIVEASHKPEKLAEYSYKAFIQIAELVVPAAVLIALGAPYIFKIFGNSYQAQGVPLLRLFVLSAIPSMVNSIFLSVSRVKRQMRLVLWISAIISILILGISYILLKPFGILGVGIAWMVTQWFIATFVYLRYLRPLWNPSQMAIQTNIKWGIKDMNKRQWKVYLARQFAGIGVSPRILRKIKYPWELREQNRKQKRVNLMLPGVLSELSRNADFSGGTALVASPLLPSESDMMVTYLARNNQPPEVMLKIPGSAKAYLSAKRQRKVIQLLRSMVELESIRGRIPEVICEGEVGDSYFYIEKCLPGISAKNILKGSLEKDRFLLLAMNLIHDFHLKTGHCTVVTPEHLSRWIDEPILMIQQAMAQLPRDDFYLSALSHLQKRFHQSLVGQTVHVSWIHGDYVPGNILVDPEVQEITGIVDWEMARPEELSILDLIQLLTATHRYVYRQEIGLLINGYIQKDPRLIADLQVLESVLGNANGQSVDLETIFLLGWLHHIADNLKKSMAHSNNLIWLMDNVEPVLQATG